MKQRYFLAPLLVVLVWIGLACSDNASPATPPVITATSPAAATAQVQGRIAINFTGSPSQRQPVSLNFAVASGAKAWDAIRAALGEGNVSSQDFGGELGIFITGFYGVQAQGNHYWEFLVNGKGSEKGVSSYEVKNGDVLEFRYAAY